MAAPSGATLFPIFAAIGQLLALLSLFAVTNGREITSNTSPKYGDFAYWNRIREEEKALKKAEEQRFAPQIELHLTNGRLSTDEGWSMSNEYRYTGDKDFKYKMEMSSATTQENSKSCRCPCAKEDDATQEQARTSENDGKAGDGKIVAQLESRNIIDSAQPQCPPGYRYEKGKCRLVEP